jgi:hypothetical protein
VSSIKNPFSSLRSFIPKISGTWSRPKRLLAVEIDGFGLKAALMRTEGRKVVFECVTGSQVADPASALAEAKRKLMQSGREIPKNSILLTPTVIPAVLELPVAPNKPRPYAQMQEMIRWELEPFFVHRVGVWKLGDILVSRGYLTGDQLQQIKLDLERRKEDKHHHFAGISTSTLFGEVAIELGFITPDQRDECLAIQQQFHISDDEMICGWSSQSPPSSKDSGKDAVKGEGKYPWLVCGMSRDERSRWIALFKRLGFDLQGIYPLVGCSAAALNGNLTPSSAMIEIRAGIMGCMRLTGERVVSLQLYYTAGQPLSEQAPLTGVSSKTDTLYLSGEDHSIRSISETLSAIGQQETRSIPVEVEHSPLSSEISPAALSGMLGAARHRLGLWGGARAVSIPIRDPGPPLRQRVTVWWISAGMAFILIIGAMEISLSLRMRSIRTGHTEALHALSALEKEESAIKERAEAVKKLKEGLLALRKEMDGVVRQRAFLEGELTRPQRILSFLDLVADALPAEMVINRFAEREGGEILITGWAMSEKVAQRFVERLAAATLPLGLKMVGLDVSAEKGRLGLSGHSAEIRFFPVQPQALPAIGSDTKSEAGR